MKYDLTTFAGRLAAIAAGETLRVDVPGEFMEYVLDGDRLVHPKYRKARSYPLENLSRTVGTWSLAPKPEKTVTITRKQLEAAIQGIFINDPDYTGGIVAYVAKELGLDEDV